MTVVLDSWAVMRLLDGVEPTATRVDEQLGTGTAIMSWINLGEVFYVLRRAHGEAEARRTIKDLEASLQAVLPDSALVLEAARIKSEWRMSYADAFAAATATRFDAPLWTGDPELLIRDAPWRPYDLSGTR